MKQVILNIPDKDYPFFLQVVENFHFVQIEKETKRSYQEIIEGAEEAFEPKKQYNHGKLKLISAKDLLNEVEDKQISTDAYDRSNELAPQKTSIVTMSRVKKILLSGPSLSNKQYEKIINVRKDINHWRTKS